MHKDIAVKLQNISKIYKLYDKPIDRLKESLHPFKKKYHKEFYALKNINLEIKKGEVLGIVGVNGAGKSTLLKIIAGVLTPTHGRVIINGKINAILELSSGLKPEMTGRENIRLNLQINGIQNDLDRLVSEIIEFADIGEHIDQPVKSYSSGMKARLGFGLATSTDPDVLIVDEVLAVGDVLFKRKCYNRIENLFKKGKTVIFVSHDAQAVVEFCSDAILLYDREIILSDHPKKVTDYYQKLVFSKDHTQVLNELNNGEMPEVKKTVPTDDITNKELEKTKFNKDFYLPDFKSKQQFEQNFEVNIFDVEILDEHHSKVNILQTGKHYTYQYKVKFLETFNNVSFGMHIKTIKGLDLTSSASHKKQETIDTVNKDDTYLVSWTLKCNLLANTYLANAGVFIGNGEQMSRIVDSYIFKVASEHDFKSGLIDLDQHINYTRLENT